MKNRQFYKQCVGRSFKNRNDHEKHNVKLLGKIFYINKCGFYLNQLPHFQINSSFQIFTENNFLTYCIRHLYIFLRSKKQQQHQQKNETKPFWT